MKIADHVFVVTGGGNGIGREVCLALLARGGRVAAVDVSAAGLEDTASVAGAADRLSTHVLDITDRGAVSELPAQVEERHGQVDGLLNVAGIVHPFTPIAELSHEQIEKVLAVNFTGVVNTTKSFLPALLERPEAWIVNVSSMGGLTPFPGQSVYGASKAAVALLTNGLRAELVGTSVGVSVVYPGGVQTDILTNSGVEGRSSGQGGGKLTSPQDAARRIVDAIDKGAARVVIGRDAQTLDLVSRIAPRWAVTFIAKKMRSHLE